MAASGVRSRPVDPDKMSEATSVVGSNQMSTRPAGPPKVALESTAKLLGMSTDELSSALQSGSKLKDLASSKGVSESDLAASVVDDLKAGAPAGAPTPSDQMLTTMAKHIVNGDVHRPGGSGTSGGGLRSIDSSGMTGPKGAHGHGRPPSGPPPAATKSAASLLDMSESDLLKELEKGTSLTDLASSKNVSTKDLLTTITKALEGAASQDGGNVAGSGSTQGSGNVYGSSMSGMFADAYA